MIWGVFQQLRIVVATPTRLVLRELPLMEWLLAFVMLLVGVNFIVIGLSLTTLGAFFIAMVIVLLSRSRLLIFDAAEKELRIVFQYPFWQRVVNQVPLVQIERAYVRKSDTGSTQIILATQRGEMGLSVYSRDMQPWKEAVCQAINDFLRGRGL